MRWPKAKQVELRNDHVGFVDYVPMGSLAKGRTVAMGNHGQMRTCASCHGDDYRGHEDAPRIAGRSAYYLIRQLADMKAGVAQGRGAGQDEGHHRQAVGCRHPQRRRLYGVARALEARPIQYCQSLELLTAKSRNAATRLDWRRASA